MVIALEDMIQKYQIIYNFGILAFCFVSLCSFFLSGWSLHEFMDNEENL